MEEFDLIPVQSSDSTDQQEGGVVSRVEMEGGDGEFAAQAGGFGANEGRLSFEGAGEFQGFSSSSASVEDGIRTEGKQMDRLMDRTINATIVLAAGTFAVTKLLSIDSDYWHVSLRIFTSNFVSFYSFVLGMYSELLVEPFFYFSGEVETCWSGDF